MSHQGDQLHLAPDFSHKRYSTEKTYVEEDWYRLTRYLTTDRNTGVVTREETILDLLPGSIQLDILGDQVEAMEVDELVFRLDHLDQLEAACKKRRKNLQAQLEKMLGNQPIVEGREKAAWWARSKPSLAYGSRVDRSPEDGGTRDA